MIEELFPWRELHTYVESSPDAFPAAQDKTNAGTALHELERAGLWAAVNSRPDSSCLILHECMLYFH
jgi:hypothetical protein